MEMVNAYLHDLPHESGGNHGGQQDAHYLHGDVSRERISSGFRPRSEKYFRNLASDDIEEHGQHEHGLLLLLVVQDR